MEWIKKQFRIFKALRENHDDFPGAVLPTEEQLAEMPKLEELVAGINTVVWKKLDVAKIPKYPVYSQNGSGSCVAMSVCLIASILYYIRTGITIQFSPSYLYQQRSNRPAAGMIGTNAFKIAAQGMLPEVLMPSMDLTEEGINAVPLNPWYKKVAEVFAFEDMLVQLPVKDLETVASVMQTTGKPVNVWYEFIRAEWTSIPFVIANIIGTLLRHSVVAVDYGMYEGEKSIAIQESWGVGATQFGVIRIIKESFHSRRNLFAAYPRRFKFDATNDRPLYDGSIISFQKCMQSIALFPKDVPFVESFGPLSRGACLKYQALRGLPQTGKVDEATSGKLKVEFN